MRKLVVARAELVRKCLGARTEDLGSDRALQYRWQHGLVAGLVVVDGRRIAELPRDDIERLRVHAAGHAKPGAERVLDFRQCLPRDVGGLSVEVEAKPQPQLQRQVARERSDPVPLRHGFRIRRIEAIGDPDRADVERREDVLMRRESGQMIGVVVRHDHERELALRDVAQVGDAVGHAATARVSRRQARPSSSSGTAAPERCLQPS